VVGSLVLNGGLVALLLAIVPHAVDRPRAAPAVFEVSLAPSPPPPPPPPVAAAPAAPIATTRRVRAARVAPPPSSDVAPAPASVDDVAATTIGPGGGDGGGSASVGGNGTGPPGVATTMPIPIGARDAQLPYTRDALLSHTEGNVFVSVVVGADGKVSGATLARGLGHGLDAIALGLATKLEFRPARDALGQPTTARITWRFHFAPPRNADSL
jgi:protein TonB